MCEINQELPDNKKIEFLMEHISKLEIEMDSLITKSAEVSNENTLLKNIIMNLPVPFAAKQENNKLLIANKIYCDLINEGCSDKNVSEIFELNSFYYDDNPESIVIKNKETNSFNNFHNEYLIKKSYISDNKGNEILLEIITNSIINDKYIKNIYDRIITYKTIAENSADIVILLDEKGNIIYISPSIETILGYSKDEFESRNITDFIFPADKRKVLKKFKQLSAENLQYDSLEFCALHKEGIWRNLEAKLTNKLSDESIKCIIFNIRDISEHIGLKEKLNLMNQRNKTILQSMPDIVMVITKKGNILEFYSSDEDEFQFKNEVLIGKNIREILSSKQNINLINKKIKDAIKKEEIEEFEFEIENHPGNRIYEARMASLKGDELLVISRDITNRKKIEEALKKSEERYRQLIEFCPIAIIVITNHYIRYINNYGLILFGGLFPEDIIGKKLIELMHPDFKEQLIKRWEWLDSVGSSVSLVEEKLFRLDGKIIDVETAAMMFYYQDEPSHLVVMRDITEQKMAKNDLLLFKSISDMSTEAIVIRDSQNNGVYFNKAYLDLHGVSLEQAMERTFSDILTKKSLEIFNNSLLPTIFNHESWSGELDIIHTSGKIIPIMINASIVMDDYNKHLYSFAFIHDISTRKQFENELLKNTEILSTLNNKLSESENELKLLNASKDKFFSIIAHDLRTPFSGFLYLSDILFKSIEKLSQEEVKNFAKLMNFSAIQLDKLFENLLLWSRVQTGKLKIEPSLIDLNDLILDNIFVASKKADEKNIIIIYNPSDSLTIWADYSTTDKIIANLLSNSIKYSYNDGIINIEYVIEKNFIKLSFIDNGIGIEENNINKLFKIDEHYFTEGTNMEKGSGLGLIIAKEFIEKNGGFINVESQHGIGSKFTITVPKWKD
jgi:PAS domain S-box-containing protein